MKRFAVLALISLLLLSSIALLPAPTAKADTGTDDSIHIYAMTHINPTDTTRQYVTIQWGKLNMSFRPIIISNSGSYEVSGIDSSGWTVSSKTDNSVVLSGASGAVSLHISFSIGTDAQGDKYLKMTSYTTVTNESQYNVTAFALYVGDGSIFDTSFFNAVMNDDFYDYYGINVAYCENFNIKLKDGSWLLALSNAGNYCKHGYYSFSANKAHYEACFAGYPTTDTRYDKDLVAVFKIKKPNAAPQTAPYKILDFIPYSNSSLYAIYDNESIFKEAKNYGFNAVLVHVLWMIPATYDAVNQTAILDIANYAHKYGMKFGLYFGWHDFAVKAYSPLNYSNENISKMLSAWNNFTAKWDNLVDFYYFDYAFTTNTNGWAYYNWKYLTQIWANTTKPIIYNGRGLWYVGGRFYPLPFEAKHIDVFDVYYSKVPSDDPFVHALNYPSIPWTTNFYDNSYTTYNHTLAERYIDYYYQWGMIPITHWGFKYPQNKGFPDFVEDFKDWKGEMYVYHDIGGTVGTRNVQLENEHEIRLLINSSTSQITVTPHIAELPVRIYTNKSVTIEYEITPTSNLVIKDLTTGKTVSWEKGSIIFTAQAGHTYEIYEDTSGAGGAGDTTSSDILASIGDFVVHHFLTIAFAVLALLSIPGRNWKLFIFFALLAVASYFVFDSYVMQWLGGGG